MTAATNNQWNILILAEEHPEFNKTYIMPSNTNLQKVMEMWTEEIESNDYWIFTSTDRLLEYDEGSLLETIGEMVVGTGVVAIRAKVSYEPRLTKKILVCLNDGECHHLRVKPNDKLYHVLRSHVRRSTALEYNGMPLDLKKTVKQSGLNDNAVINESRRHIKVNVKLSSGVIRIIELPEDNLVLHLIEMVKIYEINDFSLTYQGRNLAKDENIRKLEQVVEVTQVEFVIEIDNQRMSWKTKSESVQFSEFLSQLSSIGQMSIQKLQTMEFFCVGCRRCISFSDEDIQLLPIKCCKEKSLKLIARSALRAKTKLEMDGTQYFYEIFEGFHKCIMNCKSMRKVTEDLRIGYRFLNEKCLHKGLDFNKISQISEKVLLHVAQMEDKIKSSELNIEKLKDENSKSKAQIKMFKEENTKSTETIKALREENTIAKRTVKTLKEDRIKAINDKKYLTEENTKAAVEIRILKEENNKATVELRTLKEANYKAAAEIQKLKEQPEVPVEDDRVKLLVFYEHEFFPAAVSRPEVTSRGRYPWHDSISHIKCEIPCLRPGLLSFQEVRNAVRPLITGKQIVRIDQLRGSVNGREVAEVTSRIDDERERYVMDVEFCSDDGGLQVSWQEVEEPDWLEIREGGQVLICGGQRRIVLQIYSF